MSCRIHAEIDDPDSLLYTEEWVSPQALDSQLRSERFTRLLSVMESACKPPELEFRFVSETRGLEYLAALRAETSNNTERLGEARAIRE